MVSPADFAFGLLIGLIVGMVVGVIGSIIWAMQHEEIDEDQ